MLQHVSELHSFSMAEEYSIVCVYDILFIHSSADGYLSCSYLLAIINNVAVNLGLQIFEFLVSSLRSTPRSGILFTLSSCSSDAKKYLQ